MLSSANFQPFGDRDQSVMDGLLRRQASLCALRFAQPFRSPLLHAATAPKWIGRLWETGLASEAVGSMAAHACHSTTFSVHAILARRTPAGAQELVLRLAQSAPGSRCAAQVVVEDEALRGEAEAMNADGRKLELEALHTLGLDFFTLFLRDKIMRLI
eukprot:scaffold14682_cov124-Isochrysis_galbana.AAC.5